MLWQCLMLTAEHTLSYPKWLLELHCPWRVDLAQRTDLWDNTWFLPLSFSVRACVLLTLTHTQIPYSYYIDLFLTDSLQKLVPFGII